jgi:hypothetical protein
MGEAAVLRLLLGSRVWMCGWGRRVGSSLLQTGVCGLWVGCCQTWQRGGCCDVLCVVCSTFAAPLLLLVLGCCTRTADLRFGCFVGCSCIIARSACVSWSCVLHLMMQCVACGEGGYVSPIHGEWPCLSTAWDGVTCNTGSSRCSLGSSSNAAACRCVMLFSGLSRWFLSRCSAAVEAADKGAGCTFVKQ